MSNAELVTRLFLQIAVILIACRIVGLALRRVGQPQVVGEMVAGIVLGPSVFGLLLPGVATELFPRPAMGVLYVLSQIGLVLYMFLVGVDFQVGFVRRSIRTAMAVSLSGIVVPFAGGAIIALTVITGPEFIPAGVTPWHSTPFLGACMAITAFPVLARIIQERGLAGSRLGNLLLAAGAMNDVAAWIIVAIVLAGMSGSPIGAVATIGGALVYAMVIFLVGRPIFRRIWGEHATGNGRTTATFTSVMVVLMLGAWFTESIGIHAIFGAFLFGLALPRGPLTDQLATRMEPLVSALLLPLFFTYSGLNTSIGLLDSAFLVIVAGVVLATACFGKIIGCGVAARLSGEEPRTAFAIGALMNARGLMELIILNVGRDRGLITPTLFTIMVIMAIATTVMAGPLFELICRSRCTQEPASSARTLPNR